MAAKRVLVTGAGGFIGSHLVEALVHAGWSVRNHSTSYCNVYALKQTEECFARLGFPDFRFKRFDIDLPKGSHGGFETYTELLADGLRLQISGPIMLSWYFILAMAA